MNVDTVFRGLINVFNSFCFEDLEWELQPVNRNPVLAGMCLQAASHKALWEEQSWNPERSWRSVHKPVIHEHNTLFEINKPGSKRFQWRISNLGPVCRNLIILERQVHAVKCLRHNNESMNSLLEVKKGGSHHFKHSVELLHFLDQHCSKWWVKAISLFELFFLAVILIKRFWHIVKEEFALGKHDLIRS